MTRKKRAQAVLLAGILIFFCCRLPAESAGKIKAKTKAEEPGLDVTDIKLAEQIMMAPPYSFTFERDPFKPIVAAPGAEGKKMPSVPISVPSVKKENIPHLVGIISSGSAAYALIGFQGKIRKYQEKENIEDYLIESIEPNRVMLKREGELLELKVGGDKKK